VKKERKEAERGGRKEGADRSVAVIVLGRLNKMLL
jgi:hypothetical protein